MRSLLKICRSIIKKNKGFSICLCLMSLLSFAISVLAANFSNSANSTILNFFNYTGVPDVLVSTDLMESSNLDEIRLIDGVEGVYDRISFDVNIETEDEKQFSSRLLTYDENGPFKLEFQRKIDVPEGSVRTYISYQFADYNKLDLGDTFQILTPVGKQEAVVAGTVSSVETFKCLKDEMSNYEAYEFCYIYIPKDDFKEVVDLTSFTNSFSIYFETGLTKEKQHAIIDEVKLILGSKIKACSIVSELSSIKTINDDVNTIKVLCVFIPGVVFLISLGFSFEFLKIIINNQRKTIALLKSLGYSSSKITGIFILFTILINLVALILGLPLGFLLLRLCVGLISSANGILVISFDISILLTIALILLVFAIGILASLLTSKSITNIDPASITNKEEDLNSTTPRFVKNIRCNPFVKISLASIFRRYKRLIVGFLCMAMCIITMSVGFEGNLTLAHPIDAVYGDRFRYDLMVRDIDKNDYEEIQTNVDNIELIEPLSYFKSNIGDKEVVVSSIKENSELVVLKNASGDVVYPGSGVIVDEMYAEINNVKIGDSILLGEHSLNVTEIAREIAVPFFYISQETAENVYEVSINCVLLKVNDISNISEIKNQIIDINSNSYFSLLSSQKENMNSRSMTMRIIMLILSLLSFLIGSLFVFNITIIDFNEKKSDYVTLRAIGASTRKLSIISFIENLSRLLIGIVIAIPASYFANKILLKLLSAETGQYVMVKFWPCLFAAVAISFLYIVVSLLISRRIIRKINIVEKLNEVE